MEEKLCLCHMFEGANETSVISEYECIRRFISSFQKKKKNSGAGVEVGGRELFNLLERTFVLLPTLEITLL